MLGAYTKGSDAELDAAIARMPKVEQFLRQLPAERVAFEETVATLSRLLA